MTDLGELLETLVQSLLYSLMTIAVEFDVLDMEPGPYRVQVDRFEAIRAVLDAIEWGERGEIDVEPHRDVLQKVLSDRLSAEHSLMQEQGGVASNQREHAHACALTIEQWMDAAGLEIPQAGEHDA